MSYREYWVYCWKRSGQGLPDQGFQRGQKLSIWSALEASDPWSRLEWPHGSIKSVKHDLGLEERVSVDFVSGSVECHVQLWLDCDNNLLGATLKMPGHGVGDGNTGTVVVSTVPPPLDGSS